MIDIAGLLRQEGPSEASIDGEALRLAEGRVLLRIACGVCDDLNEMINELTKRGFEVVVHVDHETIVRQGYHYVPSVSIIAKRVLT